MPTLIDNLTSMVEPYIIFQIFISQLTWLILAIIIWFLKLLCSLLQLATVT